MGSCFGRFLEFLKKGRIRPASENIFDALTAWRKSTCGNCSRSFKDKYGKLSAPRLTVIQNCVYCGELSFTAAEGPPAKPRPKPLYPTTIMSRKNPVLTELRQRKRVFLPEVQQLAIEGYSAQKISEKLFLPRGTVDHWLRDLRSSRSTWASDEKSLLTRYIIRCYRKIYNEAMAEWHGSRADKTEEPKEEVEEPAAEKAAASEATDNVPGEATDNAAGEATDNVPGVATDNAAGEATEKAAGEATEKAAGEAADEAAEGKATKKAAAKKKKEKPARRTPRHPSEHALLGRAMEALKAIREIRGLDAPRQSEIAGPCGGPIPLSALTVNDLSGLSTEELYVIEARLHAECEPDIEANLPLPQLLAHEKGD